MYGHQGHFPPPAGGGRPPQPLTPNLHLRNPNFYHHNPAFQYFQNLGAPQQLPSYPTQNPNFYVQNPSFPAPNPNYSVRNPNLPPQNPSCSLRPPGEPVPQPKTSPQWPLERIEQAVDQARWNLHATGESVSAWKVSELVASTLQVDSWSSVGFRMQEIPALYRLMLTEGKVNAFIHCFVGVQRITSLYDLQAAICRNERVEKFEDLQLGPLLRHPLVLHYFSVNSDKIFKITSVEIISHLCEFLDPSPENDVKVEEFLDFIARKRLVSSKEKLMVRIQNLGMHVYAIREAKRLEDNPLKKFLQSVKQKANKNVRKRPLLSAEKKLLDERFSAISDRIKTFSSVHENFSGKHTRFLSSSSEDEESGEDEGKDTKNEIKANRNMKHVSEKSDRVSKCPYPSVTEEMERLGLKTELATPSSAGHLKNKAECVRKTVKNKRSERAKFSLSVLNKSRNKGNTKSAKANFSMSAPSKMPKTGNKRKAENAIRGCSSRTKKPKTDDSEEDSVPIYRGMLVKDDYNTVSEDELLLEASSMRMFIGTWKETCRDLDVAKALMRMLQSYNIKSRERRRLISLFAMYPFIGLLNVAVTSIKSGMWDNIYDALQAIDQCEVGNTVSEANTEYEIIDVQPDERISMAIHAEIADPLPSVSVEHIISKIAAFFELDYQSLSNGRSLLEKKYIIFKKLYDCEAWLMEQFAVKDFKSLGFGGYSAFIEKHFSSFPNQFQELLSMETCEGIPLDVCMFQHQLIMLVSQASYSLWDDECVTKQMISALLREQFPLLDFRIMLKGPVEDLLDSVREYGNNLMSKCIIYSSTLIGASCRGQLLSDVNLSEEKMGTFISSEISIPMTSKEAATLLLKAPMLSDLMSWSHWDQIFVPSLGPLVEFLVNEVNSKELLCLVTRDGKVIRVDQSATVDSFLVAALSGSSFLTAVQLVSLITVLGGKKHVPLSLLKCHACRAFEVIESNFQGGKVSSNMKERVPSVLRFFLECLSYVPSEFHSFAADVLLVGLRSVARDAASAVMEECDQLEHRVMLHDIGLSLGIVEWIHDYNSFTSNVEIVSTEPDARVKKMKGSEYDMNIKHAKGAFDEKSSDNAEIVQSGNVQSICRGIDDTDVKGATDGVVTVDSDAALIIESIRQDEFGLNPTFSAIESSMLKKQHARLGRALHCLSRELYSQDSHFLLELVQNADDNIYPEDVEPTLILILQESGIVVLNNERGFSPKNIRALCDVGNSTKKGSTAGYIGQKGIGFKSVFRVTDAPEIHSNGFHVKFDISEGQIGFVLPTLVPACNIDLYCRLASSNSDPLDSHSWNTCIVLPFKSKLSEGNAMKSVITKFSDLHPSLLLFLHRMKCIKFRNVLDDSLVTMKKEVLGDGLVRVSRGKERMTWLVVSEKLRADFIRRDVRLTEIALAFTLQESEGGYYIPSLEQQPVFAFLPLRTYGLKFILQGDFVLPSSREEVDGDSPWNQWLLSEFPGLFVRAKQSFCALPCFGGNRGRAVSAYMSFVPLIGEVHGFFSCLPRMIISKLRMSNCLLLEGENGEWVPPCKALRGWDEQARKLFANSLLLDHLGLGFLDKDIVLSDQLAKALGVEEYGMKTLVQVMSRLCEKNNGVESMGLDWLLHWLNALYYMSVQSSSSQTWDNSRMEADLIRILEKIAFIPLSDGTFSSLIEGPIWLHIDSTYSSTNGDYEAFPNIYCKLRIVNPSLFSSSDMDLLDNVMKILQRIGVQQLSAHELFKVHILPALCDERNRIKDHNLMIEYVCFAMVHLQSNCPSCRTEREIIISELRSKALISTNYGFKRPLEVPIHFSQDYGNPVKINRLVNVEDMRWHEVDKCYLVHPMNKSLVCGLKNWRDFFQELGITDFVQVVQVERSFADISHRIPEISPSNLHLIGPGSVVKDWESNELVNLLSLLSTNGNPECCKYLLDILDIHWDSLFCSKVTGYMQLSSTGDDPILFKSSFLSSLCDARWVATSTDDKLHCPSDLFHDCDSVRSVLGPSAPFAVPQVRSKKLLSDIGFKTKVTLNDVLEILDVWKRSDPFKASIAQMSRLYTFIWNELAATNRSFIDKFKAQKFIFVPSVSISRHDNLVPGLFYSAEEVYWHDSTGLLDQINEEFASSILNYHLPLKTLHDIYSGLHDFFVVECGILQTPRFDGYIRILQWLSSTVLPSQAANAVYKIFLKWNEELSSGSLDAKDIGYLRESLKTPEFTVLPTVQDKWVSLHPSFGLVCWGDDQKLRKEFKDLTGIDFLYFGEPSEDDEPMFRTRISNLLRALQIPSLSDVITREAKFEGPLDSCSQASLINWALPYAQRYFCSVHPEKYSVFKEFGFESVKNLHVLVVEKLFYRNLIKRIKKSSKKRYECSSILQGNTLYAAQESDTHSMFLELSRLFFGGIPDLHMANFLHMITTMAASGTSKDQIEQFVLTTQNISILPAEEPVWSITVPPLKGLDESLPSITDSASDSVSEQSSLTSNKRKAAWPPVDWKTAPDFKDARKNWLRSWAASSSEMVPRESNEEEDSEVIVAEVEDAIPDDTNVTLKMMADSESPAADWTPLESKNVEDELIVDSNRASDGSGPASGPGSSKFYNRDQLNTGAPDPAQAMLTGRLGELAAYKYFSESFGSTRKVNWVNELTETGLPYDILIGDNEYNREYIEVKATTSSRKDWFNITLREWQFAIEMGDSFSVAHVALKDRSAAKVSVFRNPVKLCQQGKLQLVLMMPKQPKELSVAPS